MSRARKVKPQKHTKEISKKSKAYQFYASDFAPIIEYYQKKGIRIILNGTFSERAKKHVKEKKSELNSKLEKYNDPSLKYATYLMDYWMKETESTNEKFGKEFGISKVVNSKFSHCYSKLKKLIGGYLDTNGDLRKDLSPNEIESLNLLCKNSGQEIKDIFDNQIKSLCESILDVNIEKIDAMEEVKEIQKSLKDDEVVGYIYTSEHATKKDHFEVLLISKKEIIKPVHWYAPCGPSVISARDIHDLSYTDISNLLENETSSKTPHPQAGLEECATLNVLYLKQLLKDDAKQLKELTLSIPYYENDEVKYFFFPSPQVLRYSQSSLFNKIMKAMLDDETQEIKHKDKTYKVTSLRKLLEDSIEQARKEERNDIVDQNTTMLNNLFSFKERWLQEYKRAEEKREKMDDGAGGNRYLVYKTKRFEEKFGLGPIYSHVSSTLKQLEQTNDPLEKSNLIDNAFKAIQAFKDPVIKENNSHPLTKVKSIFFNTELSPDQVKAINVLKQIYREIIIQAINSNIDDATKEQILKRTYDKNNIINYHTNFLFGDTSSRTTLSKFFTDAFEKGKFPQVNYPDNNLKN